MKFRKKKKKRKKSERFFFFFELKFIQIYSMIFKKKMAISHEDFRDVFLPSFSLSIFYQNTDGFETSPPRFQIPSDGWPYNLTSSYPFYNRISCINHICMYFYLESERGRSFVIIEHGGKCWSNVASIFDQSTQRWSSNDDLPDAVCTSVTLTMVHPFDDHVKESDNRLSIGVNGFRVWWYGVENSRREFTSLCIANEASVNGTREDQFIRWSAGKMSLMNEHDPPFDQVRGCRLNRNKRYRETIFFNVLC